MSTHKGTNKCESAQHRLIYQRICDGIYVYMWHMYVCKEVLTVSTRKGTDICEFAQHGVIHKSTCNMKYVYLWVYLCIQRGSKCEHSLQSVHWQGQRHMWFGTTWVHIQKYLSYDMIYVYLWIYVCLENQNPKNSSGQRKNLRYFGKNKKTSVFDWRPRVLILNPYLTRT